MATNREESNINEIVKNRDIDELVNILKDLKNSNTNDVLDLNQYFVDSNLNGVDMFLELAVKLEPEKAVHHYNRAIFLENQKSYSEALKEYKIAIELDQENEDYISEYGNLLLILNDFNGAEEQYLEALQINPENANNWMNLGIIYSYNKDLEKAEKALTKAISLEPKSSLPYLNLIKLYKNTGNKDKAKDIENRYKSLHLGKLNINVMHLDK